MPPPRLVAIDVDGTLLTSRHEVTDGTVAALRRARAAGVTVVLATSRGPAALGAILARLSEGGASGQDAADLADLADLDVLASQGAVVATWAGGRMTIVRRTPIPVELARQVVATGVAAGLAVHWYAAGSWFVSHVDSTVDREADVVRAHPQVTDLLALEDPPDKLMMIAPDSALDRLDAVRAAMPPGVVAQVSNPTYLEVTADGVDKATALRRLCAERGIAAADVAAIGDGPNDLAMIVFAGVGIAPANARPEVRAVAQRVTGSNDDEGVAAALDELLA